MSNKYIAIYISDSRIDHVEFGSDLPSLIKVAKKTAEYIKSKDGYVNACIEIYDTETEKYIAYTAFNDDGGPVKMVKDFDCLECDLYESCDLVNCQREALPCGAR